MSSRKTIKVAELFAGVGGFRLGLDGYHNPGHPEFDLPVAVRLTATDNVTKKKTTLDIPVTVLPSDK